MHNVAKSPYLLPTHVPPWLRAFVTYPVSSLNRICQSNIFPATICTRERNGLPDWSHGIREPIPHITETSLERVGKLFKFVVNVVRVGKRALMYCLLVGLPDMHHYSVWLIRLTPSHQEVVYFPLLTKQTGSQSHFHSARRTSRMIINMAASRRVSRLPGFLDLAMQTQK